MLQQGLTQKQLRQSQIAELRASVRRFNAAAQLHYKIHPTIESIDYLAVLDTNADLAAALTPSGSPEDRARLFLVSYYVLFSFYTAGDQEQRRMFDSNLFLKHTLRSRMGTHCIFTWREGPNESADEHHYVVHLDPRNQVIMVTSIYPDDTDFRSQPATWVAKRQDDIAKLPKAHEALRRELDALKAAGQRVRKVTYETIFYDKGKHSGLRVKLTTGSGDRVIVFDCEGNKIRNYATDVK